MLVVILLSFFYTTLILTNERFTQLTERVDLKLSLNIVLTSKRPPRSLCCCSFEGNKDPIISIVLVYDRRKCNRNNILQTKSFHHSRIVVINSTVTEVHSILV